MFCKVCGENLESAVKFCSKCGSKVASEKAIPQENVLSKFIKNNPIDISKVKDKSKIYVNMFKKDIKVRVITLGIASIVIIGGVMYVNKGPVSKSDIKENLYGESINIGKIDLVLSKDNLKKINIKSKSEATKMGIKSYTAKGFVEIKTDKYEIKAPYEAIYIHNPGKLTDEKGWVLTDQSICESTDEVVVKIKDKIDDDKIPQLLVGQNVGGKLITEEMLSGIELTNLEESVYGLVKTGDFNLNIEENFIKLSSKFKAEFKFDGNEWLFSSVSNVNSNLSIGEIPSDISRDNFVNIIKNFTNQSGIQLNSPSGVYISPDEITSVSDVKVDTITKNDAVEYLISANIKCKSKKINIDGLLKCNVSSKGDASLSVEGKEITFDQPTNEDIKKSLTGETINYYKDNISKRVRLTDTDCSSLAISSVVADTENPGYFYVFGTLSYDELKDDTVTLHVRYDIANETFKLSNIKSSTISNYDEYYSENAIKSKL